jgi:hypothetical protein
MMQVDNNIHVNLLRERALIQSEMTELYKRFDEEGGALCHTFVFSSFVNFYFVNRTTVRYL